MYSVKSNNLSLKYERSTPSGCKDMGIKKLEFVAKAYTYFLIITSLIEELID